MRKTRNKLAMGAAAVWIVGVLLAPLCVFGAAIHGQRPTFEDRLAMQLTRSQSPLEPFALKTGFSDSASLAEKEKVKAMLSQLLGIQSSHLSSFEAEANKRLKSLIRRNAGSIIAIIRSKDDNWLEEQLKITAARHAQEKIDEDMKKCGDSGCTITIYNSSDSVNVAAWKQERTQSPTRTSKALTNSTTVVTTVVTVPGAARATAPPTMDNSTTTSTTVIVSQPSAPKISPEFVRNVMRKLAQRLNGRAAAPATPGSADGTAGLAAAIERRVLAEAAHETLLQLERQLSRVLTDKEKQVKQVHADSSKLALVQTRANGMVDVATVPHMP